MSKDARNGKQTWSPVVAEKVKELAELIRMERFGGEGVPEEFTFSQIEEIGHQVGQMAAAEVDRTLVDNHRQHFVGEHPCPGCGRLCMCRVAERDLATRDGPVALPEAACYCPDCRRAFFPSACFAEA